jgi:flagellar hook protein FlgE
MSILNTSLSGMLANNNWLTTISQNVANANTTGYKNVETEFAALVDSGVNFNSEFSGVATSARALNDLQGQISQTNTRTDLAVQGAGYFVVSNPSGNIYLTRDGSFVPDASGNLVNAEGYYLMGTPYNSQGVSLNSLTGLVKVNVTNAGESSIPSTAATVVANLPASATAVTTNLPSTAYNSASANFTAETSLNAYDNLGQSHTLNVYFTKTGSNTWEADVFDASTGTSGTFPYSAAPLATQTLNFNPNNGQLTSGSPLTLTVPGGQSLTIDLGTTTQLASSFAVSSATINGNAPGTITQVTVDQSGTLSFNYGNGSTTPVYRIPLAKVAAPDNMQSVSGNAYQPNSLSGSPQVGLATTGGLGSIQSSSLEDSTTDLATELTQMVQAQSSYQANSKVFQTGAKMLDVLNNLQT